MIRRRTALLLAGGGLLLSHALGAQPSAKAVAPISAIAADVNYLAGPALEGRPTGTRFADSAANYIATQYARLGFTGIFPGNCDAASECSRQYFQYLMLDTTRIAHNIGAFVPGTDSSRSRQFIVVGAHFDHVGRSEWYARDRGKQIRPGADDNASGTAGVLELARRLALHPRPNPVILVNFDAEEIGLVGSKAFMRANPVPGEIVLMLNMDMIGRLRSREVSIDADGASKEYRTLADSVARALGLRAYFDSRDTKGRSDHASFIAAQISAIDFSTGLHPDYHTGRDTPERINAAGIGLVVDVVEGMIEAVGRRLAPSTRPPQ